MTALGHIGTCLKGLRVRIDTVTEFSEPGHGAVMLKFSDGSSLRAQYWRLIADGRVTLSSFEHLQKHGLPEPLDAKEEIRRTLDDQVCAGARLNSETGDLSFGFESGTRLEVFSFTCYEDWEFVLSDGAGAYSNQWRS